MPGHLELVDAADGGYQVLMLDGDGSLIGRSVSFESLRGAVEGIEMLREIAGLGLVSVRSAKFGQEMTPDLPSVRNFEILDYPHGPEAG
ncbi:hypothetical protein AB6813_08225 [bacterium RCC_150]